MRVSIVDKAEDMHLNILVTKYFQSDLQNHSLGNCRREGGGRRDDHLRSGPSFVRY